MAAAGAGCCRGARRITTAAAETGHSDGSHHQLPGAAESATSKAKTGVSLSISPSSVFDGAHDLGATSSPFRHGCALLTDSWSLAWYLLNLSPSLPPFLQVLTISELSMAKLYGRAPFPPACGVVDRCRRHVIAFSGARGNKVLKND